jgi:hypothetical protein
MQRYRFDLKLKRKWQGILEIPAILDMVANNRLYLIPKRASTTFTT